MLSMTFGAAVVALVGLVVLLSPTIDPSLAGMALVFASMVSAHVSPSSKFDQFNLLQPTLS